MLITIDIGNTNTKIAAWDGPAMVAHWRLSTQRQKLTDEYAKDFNRGYDSATSQYVDMIAAGIVALKFLSPG